MHATLGYRDTATQGGDDVDPTPAPGDHGRRGGHVAPTPPSRLGRHRPGGAAGRRERIPLGAGAPATRNAGAPNAGISLFLPAKEKAPTAPAGAAGLIWNRHREADGRLHRLLPTDGAFPAPRGNSEGPKRLRKGRAFRAAPLFMSASSRRVKRKPLADAPRAARYARCHATGRREARMKAIQKIIYIGFAAVAIASAAMPVFAAHPPGACETEIRR